MKLKDMTVKQFYSFLTNHTQVKISQTQSDTKYCNSGGCVVYNNFSIVYKRL